MFNPKTTAEKTALQEAIDSVLAEMAGFTSETEEFAKMVEQLEKLYALKEIDSPKNRVSADTLLTVGANILGIMIIVGHERAHVVTSKALTFVQKLH